MKTACGKFMQRKIRHHKIMTKITVRVSNIASWGDTVTCILIRRFLASFVVPALYQIAHSPII